MKLAKKMTALFLAFCTVVSLMSAATYAQEPAAPEMDPQTGCSGLYDYEMFDAGKAGLVRVNNYLGTVHLRRSDLSLDGLRLPVSIDFYYDPVNLTDLRGDAPYGTGWLTNYNQIVTYDTQKAQYAYKNENGTWIYFQNSGEVEDGKERWDEVTTYEIGATGATLYRIKGARQIDFTAVDIVVNELHHGFDATGRMVSLTNNGNTDRIVYAAGASSCKISEIVDPVGRKFVFAYDAAGMLSSITCKDASGKAILVNQKTLGAGYRIVKGRLVSVSDANRDTVVYGYDEAGKLTRIANVDSCGYEIGYDKNANVLTVTERAAMGSAQELSGNVTSFSFSECAAEIKTGNLKKAMEFDGCGRQTQIVVTDATAASSEPLFGYAMTYSFVTKENGVYTNELTRVRDLTEEDTTGNQAASRVFTPKESTPDKNEPKIIETKDQYGNVLTSAVTVGGLSQGTRYTYSSDGNYLLSETSPDGATVRYDYNTATGVLQSLTDANDNTTAYTYNAVRELANVHLDVSGLVNATAMEAAYTYDKGRLTALHYGDFTYAFTYDVWGNVLSVKLNGSPLVSYDYGDKAWERQVSTMTYGNGNTVYYTYDELGMVASVAYGTASDVRFVYRYSGGQLRVVYDRLTGQTTEYSDQGYAIYANNAMVYSFAYDDQEGGNYTETVNGVSYKNTVDQNDGSSKTLSTDDGLNLRYATSYDALNRMTMKSWQGSKLNALLPSVEQTYSYAGSHSNAGTRISKHEITWESGSLQNHLNQQHTTLTMGYSYDGNGNITQIDQTERTYLGELIGVPVPVKPIEDVCGIGGEDGEQNAASPRLDPIAHSDSEHTVRYAYDEANQLISAIDVQSGLTYRYSYDASGNLQTMNTYRNGQEAQALHTKTLRYSKGILTGYTEDGVTTTIRTDAMGNPIQLLRGRDEAARLRWSEARSLTGYETKLCQAAYTYNADGLRTQKTVNVGGTTKTTEFVWGKDGLAGTNNGQHSVTLLYDEAGEASGFVVQAVSDPSRMVNLRDLALNGSYTYIKNLQGDVLRVIDETGATVLSYAYDPWGVPTVSGDRALAELNPCSYRSYYYDGETGYYYLQSRYYDPTIGRFLNADDASLIQTLPTINIANPFAYCNNNAPNMTDKTGYLGKHWYNKVSNIATAIDVVIILFGFWQSRKAFSEILKFLRYNRDKLVKEIYRKLVKLISKLTISVVSTAFEVALTLIGTSIGDIIAKALDYVDPWFGFTRNNGYIFN